MNPNRASAAAAVVLLAVLLALPAGAQSEPPLNADQIVGRANHASYYQGADGRANVQMTIIDAQGNQRERRFTVLRWDQGDPAAGEVDVAQKSQQTYDGQQRFYLYFHRPADVNKMAFLVHKHLDRDDDRWMYLPALDLVRRIAASDKRTSFVGSDFFYEDISGRRIGDDHHELLETTENFYKLRSTPKENTGAEFAHFVTWVHRGTFLPTRVEYFDSQGRKYREYAALKVEHIQSRPTVVQAQMSDLRSGSRTVLAYSDVTYDLDLPESIFTERYLRRPPMQWLR
jgi:hypothetical protein